MTQKRNMDFSRFLIFLLILPMQCLYDNVILVHEGKTAAFQFSFEKVYSSSFEIQHGSREAFYRDGHFTKVGLHEGQLARLNVTVEELVGDNIAVTVIKVIIRNVSRDDGGTYICSAIQKIGSSYQSKDVSLTVRYPPGKAKCKIRNNADVESELAEMWDVVICTALEGNIPGKLLCFQDDVIAVPKRRQNNTLSQEIWKRKGQSMHCCTGPVSDRIPFFECTDSILPGKDIDQRSHFTASPSSEFVSDKQKDEAHYSPELITEPSLDTAAESTMKISYYNWSSFEITTTVIGSSILLICVTNLIFHCIVCFKVKKYIKNKGK